MIPGANILNMALTVIAKQTVQYIQFLNRRLNGIGQYTAVYADPVDMVGSWQAVPKKLYMVYGLDLQKTYFTFYTSNNVLDVQRDVSGDQIVLNGNKYQVESTNDWFHIDGWKGLLCSYQGAAT